MIYSSVGGMNPSEFISMNEATGYETVAFMDKEKIPPAFKKTAFKVLDCIEKEGGKKITGGANDNLAQSFNVFSSKVRESIEDSEGVRSYYFRIPRKLTLGFGINVPNDYKDFAAKVFAEAGFKRGQQIGNGGIGYYWYIKSKSKDNKENCYFLGWCMSSEQMFLKHTMSIVIQCVVCDGDSKAFIESTGFVSSEGAAVNGFEDTTEGFDQKRAGFDGMSPDDYIASVTGMGLERSEELSKGPYEDFFRDPKVMEKFTENMDLSDSVTRKAILVMNEAEQNAVLTSLTSKLYDNIVSKVDDIDYGDIPMSKGDVTKLANYQKLCECIDLLRDILKEFKQDTGPIDVLSEALGNLQGRKDLFGRAFRYNVELPIIMYNNTVLSIINGVSYMIATCIEFIKTPNQDTFQITLDKVAYVKSKSNMIYNTLKKFNKCCASGDFDKGMEHVLQHRIKGGLGEGAVIATVTSAVLIILSIIPILREMVFFFYYTRMRVSDFFDIQADLLQMNAYNVQNNPNKTEEEKERIVSKQLKVVELFRKIANKISFTNRKAEVDSAKEIERSSRKMKISDVSDELPDSVSALF